MGDTLKIQLPAYHPGQQKIIDRLSRFNVIMCGRRFGKTTMGISYFIQRAMESRPVAWCAPTYKYLDPVFEEAAYILSPLKPRVDRTKNRIVIPGFIDMEFWTMEDENACRSRKYAHMHLDEAGFIKNLKRRWDSALSSTLMDYEGTAMFTGTPAGMGDFYNLYLMGKNGTDSEYAGFNASTLDNPFISRKELEKAKLRMPPEIYGQEILGIPIAGDANPFGLDAIRRQVAPLSDLPPVVFGVDLAQRKDWTVVIGLDVNGHVCHFTRFQHRPWPETMQAVADIVGEVPAKVDATGVGVPIVDDLRRRVGNIIPFVFTRPSKQQLMGGLCNQIQGGGVSYPAGPIVDELESFEVNYSVGGTSYNAPEGLHDDCVCALALAASELGRHFIGTDIVSVV
jgi:hypothetical protein